jgi:hypothetical protein
MSAREAYSALTGDFVELGQRVDGVDGVRVLRAQCALSALQALGQYGLGVAVPVLLKIELR